MIIFDLLFIAVVFTSLATLTTAARRRARALVILRKFGVCAIAYLSIVVVVALFSPQRVLAFSDIFGSVVFPTRCEKGREPKFSDC